jgi:hypothetical protein
VSEVQQGVVSKRGVVQGLRKSTLDRIKGVEMPLLKCSKCHHEWESARLKGYCDWCGASSGQVLEEKTALERFVESRNREHLERMLRGCSGTANTSIPEDMEYYLF